MRPWFRVVDDRPAYSESSTLGGFFRDMIEFEQFKKWQDDERKKEEEAKKKKEPAKKNAPMMPLADAILLTCLSAFVFGPLAVFTFVNYVEYYAKATAAMFK